LAHLNQPVAAPLPVARLQIGAIARLRWQIFRNSLRTMRGRMEFVSWIFIAIWFAALGFGGAFGLGIGAWWVVARNQTQWLAALLWPIFMFWTFFPLIATAFTEAFDSASLLRYPLNYSSFFTVNLIYGSLDASTMVCGLWLLGVTLGIAIAAPAFSLWTLVVLIVFGLTCLFLVRAVFAWIDRWLAQRKTREIMGVLFFVCIICFQMIGPLINRFGHRHMQLPAYLAQAIAIQRFLPAGLAAEAILRALHAEWGLAAAAFSMLVAYSAAFLLLFHLRLRAQYVGENFGEAPSRASQSTQKTEARSGWTVPGLTGPLAAMIEKEVRYLSRASQTLFTLVMPMVVLLIFRFNANPARPRSRIVTTAYAFPVGVAYALLILTNLIYNSFADDSAGIQFYFLAPVRFRQVLIAKNFVHAAILAIEALLVWIAASFFYGRPETVIVAITLTALLFAAPLNLIFGNLLSIYSPKKHDFGSFGRQRASGASALAGLAVQVVIIATSVVAIMIGKHFGNLWFAILMLAVFAAIACAAYRISLNRIDGIGRDKREQLIAILAKSS
jgi:ABC-2 type transport system permease protein